MKFLHALILWILDIATLVFKGWTISVLWGWFVVTKFSSAPQLSALSALGLIMVVELFIWSCFRRPLDTTQEQKEDIGFQLVERVPHIYFVALSLAVGFVVHLLFPIWG